MDSDDFDDVDIGVVSHSRQSPVHRQFQSTVSRPGSTYNGSPNKTPQKTPRKTPQSTPQKTPRPSYSPSKRLKQLRERKEPLDLTALDNSDDELDESTIIYDVPLSQSLVQLSQNQKLVLPKLMSFASDSTRQSSLMSYDHQDASSDFEMDLFDEALKITKEFAQDKAIHASQEAAMRCHILQQLEKPQGIEDQERTSDTKKQHVTNTRPTHLPPKDRAESLRHSKEVELLKQRAIKEELRLEKQRLKDIELRKKMKEMDKLTWEREIIPDFKHKIELSSTRELWWRGIPPSLRKFVWLERLDNKSVKPATMQGLKGRAFTLIKTNSPTVQKIKQDLTTVFPDLNAFQTGQMANDLVIVLTMYSQHCTYDPALTPLAAVLIYNIGSVNETFVALCGLLNRRLLKILYNHPENLNKESQSFLRTLKKKNTRLFTHLCTNLQIPPSVYLPPILKPVFSNLVSMDVASAIMDIYIFEGDSFLWRCVLALFEKIGYKLYGNEKEILDVIGWDALKKLNGEEVGVWWRYLDVGDDMEFLNLVRLVLKKNSI